MLLNSYRLNTRIPPFGLQDDYENEATQTMIYSPITMENARWGPTTSKADKIRWMETIDVRKGYPSCLAGHELGWYNEKDLHDLAESGQCYLPDVDVGRNRFCAWSLTFGVTLPKEIQDICSN